MCSFWRCLLILQVVLFSNNKFNGKRIIRPPISHFLFEQNFVLFFRFGFSFVVFIIWLVTYLCIKNWSNDYKYSIKYVFFSVVFIPIQHFFLLLMSEILIQILCILFWYLLPPIQTIICSISIYKNERRKKRKKNIRANSLKTYYWRISGSINTKIYWMEMENNNNIKLNLYNVCEVHEH